MSRSIILVGDSTSHGGKVLAGDEGFGVLGKKAAWVGDAVSCPKYGGNQTIVEGTPRIISSNGQICTGGNENLLWCDIDCFAKPVSSIGWRSA
ncbi:PAAR domain-containing protein [Photorhabdus laumondii]|uniref:PAAR domain-containing protein n=1 Tax=Photorhabdus laumondii TaxID=2218628 RepID=UPI0033161F04